MGEESLTMLLAEKVKNQEMFRLAALIFSEYTNEVSKNEILYGIIKSVFVDEDNQEVDIDTITANVLNRYSLIITDEEANVVINQHYSSFESRMKNDCDCFKLTDREYKKTKEEMSNNIGKYIVEYINSNPCDDSFFCQNAIYKYLYKLLSTNINSYQLMFSKIKLNQNIYDSDIFIDIDGFSDEEIVCIHGFLEWDNPRKNESLINIISCCLEYCLLVTGDGNSIIADYIQNRVIFLDTNIIFRAIGINGKARQNVTQAFLKKAEQAKLKIIITSFTRTEFFETIEKYISQILLYDSGEIFSGAYEQLSDYNIFSFYYEWLESHAGLSLKYFREYIKSCYDRLVSEFGISTNLSEKINIYSKEAIEKRRKYEYEITDIKNKLRNLETDFYHRYEHDALLVFIAEETYDKMKLEGKQSECIIVSTDRVLRFWDVKRENNRIPLVVYPSQLFLILVKLCGRSTDDMKSFISFINVRSRSKQLTPEKANVVISGISSITNDLNSQRILVSSVFDDDFQKIIKGSNDDKELYNNVQNFSQNYLQVKLEEKDLATQTATSELEKVNIQLQDEQCKSDELEGVLRREIEDKKNRDNKVLNFAKSHVSWKGFLIYDLFPLITIILTSVFLVFIFLQIFFCQMEWNIVTKFIIKMEGTTLGDGVDGFALAIDGVIAAFLGWLYGIILKNKLFHANMKTDYLERQAKLYIKKNKLN